MHNEDNFIPSVTSGLQKYTFVIIIYNLLVLRAIEQFFVKSKYKQPAACIGLNTYHVQMYDIIFHHQLIVLEGVSLMNQMNNMKGNIKLFPDERSASGNETCTDTLSGSTITNYFPKEMKNWD